MQFIKVGEKFISKTEWYLGRVAYTFGLSIIAAMGIGFLMCMVNLGLWIDGKTDDQVYGIVLMVVSVWIGWKYSGRAFKAAEEYSNPIYKIVYEHEGAKRPETNPEV